MCTEVKKLGKLEVKKLAKTFSALEWVDEVTVFTNKTLKGFGAGKTWLNVDIELGDINTVEEYNNKVALIQSYIPDADKLIKEYDGYRINLIANQDDNTSIYFKMRIRDRDVIGSILGCKLVEVKKTHTSLVCELKAKSA